MSANTRVRWPTEIIYIYMVRHDVYIYIYIVCSFMFKGGRRWYRLQIGHFFKKSLHLNDNTGFCSIIQASKLVFGSLLAKNQFFCPILNTNFCILPDGQLWEWLAGGVALPQSKCNWSVGFAIARWPVGKASDNARIMLSSLFRYSLV